MILIIRGRLVCNFMILSWREGKKGVEEGGERRKGGRKKEKGGKVFF